jgi:hypothetical protein
MAPGSVSQPAVATAGDGVGVGAGAATLSGVAGDGAGGAGWTLPVVDVTAPEPKPVLPAGPMQYLGGILGGAVGAVIATAVWYGVVAVTNWQIGLVAVAVGFIVGQGVLLGAAGRGSILLVPISLGFTLVALVASEFLIANYFLTEVALEMGMDPELARTLYTPVELVRTSLESDPLTLVFWAIAGYQAVVIPMRSASR